MKGVIDFGQLGLKAHRLNEGSVPILIDSETVFMPYHNHITRSGYGLIEIGHPPYDNNLLVETVVASLYAHLKESESQIPQEVLASMQEFGKEVVKYLVSNTLRNKGDDQIGSYRRNKYELRLIQAALAVEKYFQTTLIDNSVFLIKHPVDFRTDEAKETAVEEVSKTVEAVLAEWLSSQ